MCVYVCVCVYMCVCVYVYVYVFVHSFLHNGKFPFEMLLFLICI